MEVRKFIARLLVCCACLLPAQVWAQSQAASVFANAQVQVTPPRITLQWLPGSNVTGYQIWRKLKGGTNWGSPVANLGAGALSWADNSVSLGVSYEYKIVRSSSNLGSGYGYVNAGIELPMVEARGKLILLVDNTFSASLVGLLEQLRQDLEADGWTVLRHNINSGASVPSVKTIVTTDYSASPTTTKALFLLGHIPVPYSGDYTADGHNDHTGAWPADIFYGDIDGVWTDTQVNNTSAGDPRNDNVPGDGKYDQNDAPTSVELAVGRVDFSDLPLITSGSASDLMEIYLGKLHTWKIKGITANKAGLVDDNFGDYLDNFASNGYRGFAPLVEWSNISQVDYFTSMTTSSYLWSYGCGSGSWNVPTGQNAEGVGSTVDFDTNDPHGIFTMLFGSYFGDWDSENNLMRSSLTSGDILSCAWAGWPNWYFQYMGIGEPIGFSVQRTQNNVNPGQPHPYTPTNHHNGSVHVALMGDPTLRMDMVAPPSNVVAMETGNGITLTWSTSPDVVTGYYVFGKHPNNGKWYRLTNTPVQGTSINLSGLAAQGAQYMVRAEALTNGASGSYYNLSLGALSNEVNQLLPPGAGSAFGSLRSEMGPAEWVENITVSPNPTNGTVEIFGLTTTHGVVRVFSNTGAEVLSMPLVSKLDMSRLEPGAYMLVVEGSAGNILQRTMVVKQ